MQLDRRSRGEDGAVAVLVALLIVPLVAAAALAIDIGMLVNERRNAQIAADHAALAAAYADCHGGNAVTAGTSIGTANGFGGVSITSAGAGFRAHIDTSIEAGFANVIGIDTLNTEAEAVAECRDIVEDFPALFASEECGGIDELSWVVSGGTITGDIHSNDDLRITGSGNTVTGSASYVDDESVSAGNPGIDPTQGSVADDPLALDISTYAPGGVKWLEATAGGMNRNPSGTGNLNLNPSAPDGLYYTTGDITINSALTATVTLVSATGTITINGNNQRLTPWDTTNQVLAFANAEDCDDERIQRIGAGAPGAGSTWTGILYAPNSQIRLSGSNLPTVTGAMVAATLDIQGSNISVDASALPGVPIPTTRLTE